MKLWYHPDVALPWGARLWERGWPDTMRSNTAESGGGMMLTPCFWMFPALCRMFCWEMLAKGTWRPLQEAQGAMVRVEGCRERYSGMGMGARAIAQARAEALYPHPRPRKLLPFLPPCLAHGLQKAHTRTRGVVRTFSSCCTHARNRLLVLCWLPVHANEIQWKRLLSKGRTGDRCKGLGDCKKWMASLPCYPARTTAWYRWDSTKYNHWPGITYFPPL